MVCFQSPVARTLFLTSMLISLNIYTGNIFCCESKRSWTSGKWKDEENWFSSRWIIPSLFHHKLFLVHWKWGLENKKCSFHQAFSDRTHCRKSCTFRLEHACICDPASTCTQSTMGLGLLGSAPLNFSKDPTRPIGTTAAALSGVRRKVSPCSSIAEQQSQTCTGYNTAHWPACSSTS